MEENEKKGRFECPSCKHPEYEVVVAPRPGWDRYGLYRCGQCLFAFTDPGSYAGPGDGSDKPN